MDMQKEYFKHLYKYITPKKGHLNNTDSNMENKREKLTKNHFDKLQKLNQLKYLISKAEK